jgi:hypothetical protein
MINSAVTLNRAKTSDFLLVFVLYHRFQERCEVLEDDPYNTWSGTIRVVYCMTGNCWQTELYPTEKIL